MVRAVFTLGTAFAFAVLAFVSGPAEAASKPTVLIMAADGDADGIPRKSRISTRILDEVSSQLSHEGYEVYDETALTLDTHVQGRSNRTNAELIDIGKSIRRPPIDVVVFFTVFAESTRKTYVNELHMRIAGRMLGVQDGRFIDKWEEKVPDRWALPNRCFPGNAREPIRECVLEAVGDDAKIIAADLGVILTEKLTAWIAAGGSGSSVAGDQRGGMERRYELVFDGFDSRDWRDIEEYLVIFSGYISHRPQVTRERYREVSYMSTISTAKLQRNMTKLVDVLGLDATVRFSGNTYTLRNKRLQKRRSGDEKKNLYQW